MSIVGEAIFPVIMGQISDKSTIQTAYVVPAICFLAVLYFALKKQIGQRSKTGSGPLNVSGKSQNLFLMRIKLFRNAWFGLLLTGIVVQTTTGQTTGLTPYTENWTSLANHTEAPVWFKDAKFGIYFHWGVFSVPAFGDEWYPRNMHFQGSREYKHHLANYGAPDKFGYHDFVPMFKAEKFDADEWADLFKKAGARFAGPVAEHHDGFAMWASKASPWNAKDMGPKRDITGELSKAIKGRNMKLITTFHHERQLQRYADKPDEKKFNNSHYPFIQGMPPTSMDPKLRLLYGYIPENEWLETIWFGKLKEVIDGYNPDIIWFDSWLDEIPEAYRQKFCAYYLNEARRKKQEVVIVRKQDDLPLSVSVDDLEKSRKNRLDSTTWMTDETISNGSWCYTENLRLKPTEDVLHILIDIVSKNGVLLLNISPKADGTIPDDQKTTLLNIGKWLDKNGESIYGTRAWYTYGEGPTKEPEGSFDNHQQFAKIKYSNKDIRFTTKGTVIYATMLGKPTPGQPITIESFAKAQWKNPVTITGVTMLSSKDEVKWTLADNGLSLTAPAQVPDDMATVFKITTEK